MKTNSKPCHTETEVIYQISGTIPGNGECLNGSNYCSYVNHSYLKIYILIWLISLELQMLSLLKDLKLVKCQFLTWIKQCSGNQTFFTFHLLSLFINESINDDSSCSNFLTPNIQCTERHLTQRLLLYKPLHSCTEMMSRRAHEISILLEINIAYEIKIR